MTAGPYTATDLRRGEQIVRELHGLKGYDAWAEHIAKEIASVREASASLVEQLMRQAPQAFYGKPDVRLALSVAARAVRRGRLRTERERLINLAAAMEEGPFDDPDDQRQASELAARIRSFAPEAKAP